MLQHSLIVSLALVTLVAGCKKKDGDFEGEIDMKVTRAGAAPSIMSFQTSKDQVRLDLSMNGQQSHALVRGGLTVLVMDSQKAYMDVDMTKAGAAVAAADPGGAKPTVTKTGKHETVAGRDCEVWDIRHGSGTRTEACITEGLASFDFGALLPGAAPPSDDAKQKKLFPLRSVDYDASGKETSRMEVVTIDKKSIDPSRFEIPADYKKVGQ